MNKLTIVEKHEAETQDRAQKNAPQTVSQILEMGALDIRAALASGQIIHTCETLNHTGSEMAVIASFVVCPRELGEEIEKRLAAVVDDFFERCGITGAIDDPPTIQ